MWWRVACVCHGSSSHILCSIHARQQPTGTCTACKAQQAAVLQSTAGNDDIVVECRLPPEMREGGYIQMEGPGTDAANDRQWRTGYGQHAMSNRQLVAVQRNWDHADQIPQKMVSRQRLGSNRHSLAMICTWGWAEPQALGGSEPCPNHDWMYVRPAGAGPEHVPSALAWVSSACLMHPIPVAHAAC